jgi:hypothetical protein
MSAIDNARTFRDFIEFLLCLPDCREGITV